MNEEQYFEDLEDLEGVGDEDYAFFEASQCIVKGDATYSYALDNTLSEDGQTELYEHRRVVADSGQNPVRVDKFLMDHLRDTSRNRIQKAAEAGYIMANGKPVKSNYKVKAGDVITINESSTDSAKIKELLEECASKRVPKWLDVNTENGTAKVVTLPAREDIDFEINEQLIVEFYSK